MYRKMPFGCLQNNVPERKAPVAHEQETVQKCLFFDFSKDFFQFFIRIKQFCFANFQ